MKKVVLILLFLASFADGNCQLSKKHELSGGNSVTVLLVHDSLTFAVKNAAGTVKTYFYGQMPTDTVVFKQAPFLVKKGKKLSCEEQLTCGDSILILSVPDWKGRFFLFRFHLTASGYAPSELDTDNTVQSFEIIKTPYIFANCKYNYIANFTNEQKEFFYGETSAYYCLLELTNIIPDGSTGRNSIRMDQRYFKAPGDLTELNQRQFLKFIRKALKKANVPL